MCIMKFWFILWMSQMGRGCGSGVGVCGCVRLDCHLYMYALLLFKYPALMMLTISDIRKLSVKLSWLRMVG